MEDLIGRKAALEAISYSEVAYYPGDAEGDVLRKDSDVKNALMNVPAAQPEIIYCRECKHFDSEISVLDDAWCHVWGGTTFGDQFCSYGEKEAKDDKRRGY